MPIIIDWGKLYIFDYPNKQAFFEGVLFDFIVAPAYNPKPTAGLGLARGYVYDMDDAGRGVMIPAIPRPHRIAAIIGPFFISETKNCPGALKLQRSSGYFLQEYASMKKSAVVCKYMSDRDNKSEQVRAFGIQFEYVGKIISVYINEGFMPTVW